MRFGFGIEPAHIIDGLFHDVDRAGAFDVDLRDPERLHLVLEILHAMAEEAGLLRRALGIDENRQVAAQSHGVHGFEEERAMAAEQVLDIMLRGRDQDVDPGLVHQPVEPRGIERGGVLVAW